MDRKLMLDRMISAKLALEEAVTGYRTNPLAALAALAEAQDHIGALYGRAHHEQSDLADFLERLVLNLQSAAMLFPREPRAVGYCCGFVLCEVEGFLVAIARSMAGGPTG